MTLTYAKVFAFMLAVVGGYAYVGQLLPQFEEHPPRKKVITPETPPDELVAAGQELVRGKGGCLICHKDTEAGNERGPDLRQAAGKAATRKPGMGAEAYLLEALLKPDEYLVEGYPRMMPAADQPPVNLSIAEIKAIVAYLQSLGGVEPTVKILPEDLRAATAAGRPAHRGRELFATYGCIACHKVEGEGGELGPDLTGSAETRDPRELLRKIVDPAVWTTPGYQAGIMPADLGKSVPEGDLHEIVAYLAALSGKPYSATGAASPWSHEGVRLGLAIFVFNTLMLLAIALAGRGPKREEAARG